MFGVAHDRPLTPALAPGRTGTAGMMLVALAAVPLWSPRAPGAGPLAFAAVGLVLLLFSVGWVAMNRRSPHAGALYAVIARGLGRPVGVGAGWIALLAYTALQIGLYGRLGAAVGPLLRDWFAVSPPWWMVVAGCWLVVALCGLLRVQVLGALLGVLVLAEVAGLGVAGVLYARSDGTPLLSGTLLTSSYPALGPLLAGAALAFAGFETAAVYGEEARSPRRALPGSAYGVVAVAALLYAGVFPIAASSVPGRVVLVTGLLAGLIALHHTIARYLFALGRERLLPAALGRTARRTCAPRAGSLVQSLLAAVLLFGCWYAGGGIPTRLGAGGALAVLRV